MVTAESGAVDVVIAGDARVGADGKIDRGMEARMLVRTLVGGGAEVTVAVLFLVSVNSRAAEKVEGATVRTLSTIGVR